MLFQLIRRWFYGSFSKDVFVRHKDAIRAKNHVMLGWLCKIGMPVGLFAWGISFLAPPMQSASALYFLVFVCSAIGLILHHQSIVAQKKLLMPVYYGIVGLELAIFVILGTFMLRDMTATVYLAFMFVLPLFILDYPGRVTLFLAAINLVFCSFSLAVKPFEIALIDCMNVAVLFICNAYLLQALTNIQLSEILHRYELERQRDTDSLTGLYNRGAVATRITQSLAQHQAVSLLLLVDLDHFKMINDTFGHSHGDMLLIEVAERLRKLFPETDCIARIGGDEFLVFWSSAPARDLLEARMERLMQALRISIMLDDQARAISASVGVVLADKPEMTYDELYRNADRAMYAAKADGKDCYSFQA